LATVHDNAILQNVSGLIFFNRFTYYTDVMMFMLIYICKIILWVCVCASRQFEKNLMTVCSCWCIFQLILWPLF